MFIGLMSNSECYIVRCMLIGVSWSEIMFLLDINCNIHC